MWTFADEANFDTWDEGGALPLIMDQFAEYMFKKLDKPWPSNSSVGILIISLYVPRLTQSVSCRVPIIQQNPPQAILPKKTTSSRV